MGIAKEQMFENENTKFEKNLAYFLGITIDELDETNYEIDTNTGYGDGLYGYIITFDDDTPKEILDKIANVDENNQVWLNLWELDNLEYETYEYDPENEDESSYSNVYKSFTQIENILEYIDADFPESQLAYRQQYISVLSAFETYLWENVVQKTKEEPKLINKLIKNHPVFEEDKYKDLSDKEKETIAKNLINDIPYSNFKQAQNMYQAIFGIEITFPNKYKGQMGGVRNHLVHRNGKNKKGELVPIGKKEVDDLLIQCKELVERINYKINYELDFEESKIE